MHDDTSARLAVLRAALTALPMGMDGPDRDRLHATLQALDPLLSGGALGPPGWVGVSGMPSPAWVRKVVEARRQAVLGPAESLPDEHVVQATALAPELGRRLLAERTFRRFLARHPVFPMEGPQVMVDGDAAWWTWDGLTQDGRWVRLRTLASGPRPTETSWWTDPWEAVVAAVGAPARRGTLGPVAWHAGRVVGLLGTVEASGESTRRVVAVDRMHAEDLDAGDATVLPIAVA